MSNDAGFWGREAELESLRNWSRKGAKLVALYGRRRVGKTRLVEEAFNNARLLKIEGLEGAGQAHQQRLFLSSMADFFNRSELKLVRPGSWIDIFSILSDSLGTKPCVVFLDEFQWLASGRTRLVSQLKYAWDNLFSKKNRVLLILCGSVSSFMVNRVLKSKALYGRVDQEMHLRPLRLGELRKTFVPKRSAKELVELYMVMGGIPQYLKMVNLSKSVLLNIQELCFRPNAYLANEFERLFASHFGTNRRYRDILLSLAKRGWANRNRLKKDCRLDSGGRVTEYLENLELAGFIESYTPVDKPAAVRNLRYRICDPYLRFYFTFVHHKRRQISQFAGGTSVSQFLPSPKYNTWRGLAFESICYAHRQEIAAKLGFSAISYYSGSWFAKGDEQLKTQIDLLFDRADGVVTICEIKFTDKKIGLEAIGEMEKKIDIFPNPKQRTVEKVLISAAPPTDQLVKTGYFHSILSIDALF
ncbi:MAG: ATP-binding protein [Proteobacteria bacterium]|nr:ATP-binding protein [Pseudomonadota bacterium]